MLVKDAGGRVVGDLDVAAWDPDRGTLLVVEAKWPVDAATLAESQKVDDLIERGRAQLRRVQSAIERGGAKPLWPKSWRIDADTTVHWWVGSAQQLDSRSTDGPNAITSTSLRLVEHLLPAEHLDDLIQRLHSFPLPRRGVEYELVPGRVEAEGRTLHFEALHLLGALPRPPSDRRVQNGYT